MKKHHELPNSGPSTACRSPYDYQIGDMVEVRIPQYTTKIAASFWVTIRATILEIPTRPEDSIGVAPLLIVLLEDGRKLTVRRSSTSPLKES
jgi:hypothetical protein